MDKESAWDKLLQIKTTGRDDTHADQYHHPYEPTPYGVLERLASSGWIRQGDVVLDYGCGKGRVDFFLSYRTKARTIGIEYDDGIYRSALENQQTAASKATAEFVLANGKDTRCRWQSIGANFSTPSRQKSSARLWHESWSPIMKIPGKCSSFSTILRTNTFPI